VGNINSRRGDGVNWKTYISSKFSGCRHIASARDPHRGRDVKLYAVPGEFEHVGVSDGTDCWIAPVATSFVETTCRRQLDLILLGKEPLPAALAAVAVARRRAAAGPVAAQQPQQAPDPLAAPRERRRAVPAAPPPAPIATRRRVSDVRA
jgi:hypothetical protein